MTQVWSRDEQYQIRLMAIALVQESIGRLDDQTALKLAVFEEEGLAWREYVIRQLNGFDLPPDFIKLAIAKRWEEDARQDPQAFTQAILAEWRLL